VEDDFWRLADKLSLFLRLYLKKEFADIAHTSFFFVLEKLGDKKKEFYSHHHLGPIPNQSHCSSAQVHGQETSHFHVGRERTEVGTMVDFLAHEFRVRVVKEDTATI
jgi:hypothetical protein